MPKKVILHLAVELHWPGQPDDAVPDEYRSSVLSAVTDAMHAAGAGGTMLVLASSAYAINPPPPEPQPEPEEPTP
jgi:nucleoside-diphosphate-sugar epimerase